MNNKSINNWNWPILLQKNLTKYKKEREGKNGFERYSR